MMAENSFRLGWAAVVALALLMPGSGNARALHGVAEVQYLNQRGPGRPRALESWVKTVQMGYARRLPGALELSSRFLFSEQTLTGRPDRSRAPQGSLQLAHPLFGLLASYRPVEVTDSRSLTTRQQELSLTGYAQKAGLPRVTGSWIRRHQDTSPESPASAAVTRSLSADYGRGWLSLRAGYGDQYRQAGASQEWRKREDHVNLGSSAQFQGSRAGLSLLYDYNQSRAYRIGSGSELGRLHTAGVSSDLQLSRRTSGSLAYTYRRAENARTGAHTEENDGTLSLSHNLSRGVRISGAGGVRSATFNNERTETERYVVATASADGEARPGWRLGTAASHSLNWLPGARVRPIDSFRSNTVMRLARGLDFSAELSLTAARRPVVPPDTSGARTELTLQTGAGIHATPLRALTLDSSVRRYRVGTSLGEGGSSTTSYANNLQWRASQRLRANGGWDLRRGLGSRSSTLRTSILWSPNSSIQASGSFSRTKQARLDPSAPSAAGREDFSGSLVMALNRDLTGTIRYSEGGSGLPTHLRQVNVTLTQTLWR
jgi:hypothetical protein